MSYTVDWPDAEYHEILPNLYLGGHLWRDGLRDQWGKHSTISKDESWDYVVSAYFDTKNDSSWPLCDHRLVPFSDTEQGLSDLTWSQIKSAVDAVVRRWLLGEKVLVRCQAGFNRSGLMMSLILMRLGFTADVAINRVRRKRSPCVLVNKVFESYVREREEEYRDPANLVIVVNTIFDGDEEKDVLIRDIFEESKGE